MHAEWCHQGRQKSSVYQGSLKFYRSKYCTHVRWLTISIYIYMKSRSTRQQVATVHVSAQLLVIFFNLMLRHWQQELTLTSFAALFFHPLGGLESHTTALRQNVVRTCEEHLQRRNAHDTPMSDGDSCAVLCLVFFFFFLPDFSLMYALPHHDDMP